MYMRHFALASQITICENAHGGPSRVTGLVCKRKRRQSCSKVDSDNAHDPPDDPASRPSVKNRTIHQRSWTDLGQPNSSWTTPRCRAHARQAQARRSRCASRLHALRKQSVAIIPRTRKSQACLFSKMNRGRESGPGICFPQLPFARCLFPKTGTAGQDWLVFRPPPLVLGEFVRRGEPAGATLGGI